MKKIKASTAAATVPDTIYLEAAEWLDVLADRPQDKITARRFQNWLQQDPRHRLILERMANTWSDPALGEAAQRAKNSLSIKQRYTTASAGYRGLWRGLAAVACSTVFAVVLLLTPLSKDAVEQPAARLVVETPVAVVRNLELADGSTLEVNADSRLSVQMDQERRLVDLHKGSTYFAVAPDKERPFAVTIGEASVVAVGTEFNIDRTSSGVDVTVHEGAIEVRATPANLPTLVRAGEHIRIEGATLSRIQHVELERLLDWRSGWIEIDDEPLTYLLEQVSRYSVKPIELKDADLARLRVAGRFQLKKPEATLALLQQLYALRTVEQKERILVYPSAS